MFKSLQVFTWLQALKLNQWMNQRVLRQGWTHISLHALQVACCTYWHGVSVLANMLCKCHAGGCPCSIVAAKKASILYDIVCLTYNIEYWNIMSYQLYNVHVQYNLGWIHIMLQIWCKTYWIITIIIIRVVWADTKWIKTQYIITIIIRSIVSVTKD